MKKKLILQAVAFILLAALMLTGLGLVLREKSGALSELYSLERDSVSVLFSGGSHVNATYIPAVLWSEYDIASTNLFSANQPLWTSYHYIKEALKTQKPDLIALELFGLSYGFSYSVPEAIDADNAVAGFHMRLSPNFYGMALSSSIFGVESCPFPEYLNLVRYHSRWKLLTADDFSPMTASRGDFMRGYELLTRVESFKDASFSEKAAPLEPYIGSRIYLELIRRLAEREGIPLLLCVSPYAVNETERGIYAWARAYADEHGLAYLNYNGADGERIGVDRARDLADVGHTNYTGALKVTEDIGRYIAENFELRGRDVPDAAQRDADALEFAAKAEINRDMSVSDPAEFFALAAANESYTVFAAGELTEAQLADIAPLGFEGLEAGAPFAGVSTGGRSEELLSGAGALISRSLGQYEITAGAAAMTVNGEKYAPEEGEAVFLVYDNANGWPLDLEWYSVDGTLAHREFAPSELLTLIG